MQICPIDPVLTPGRYRAHCDARTASLQWTSAKRPTGPAERSWVLQCRASKEVTTQLLPQQAVAGWVYRSVVNGPTTRLSPLKKSRKRSEQKLKYSLSWVYQKISCQSSNSNKGSYFIFSVLLTFTQSCSGATLHLRCQNAVWLPFWVLYEPSLSRKDALACGEPSRCWQLTQRTLNDTLHLWTLCCDLISDTGTHSGIISSPITKAGTGEIE